jgi:Flp pilus assembly protein TadD
MGILCWLLCFTSGFALAQRTTPSAEQHFNRGIALLQGQQPDRAIGEFEAAIRLKPQYAEAHNALGLALARKGLVKFAAESFRRAIELDPKQYKTYRNLGRALLDLGDIDGAIGASYLSRRSSDDRSAALPSAARSSIRPGSCCSEPSCSRSAPPASSSGATRWSS